VRIAEVAQRMAAQAKRPTRVVYTGLRTGEKLHEVLLGAREADERPIQPAMSHVAVPSLDPLDVRTLDRGYPRASSSRPCAICASTRWCPRPDGAERGRLAAGDRERGVRAPTAGFERAQVQSPAGNGRRPRPARRRASLA